MGQSKTFLTISLILLLALVLGASAGGVYLYKEHRAKKIEAEILKKEQEIAKLKKEQRRAELDILFKQYIEDFTADLKKQAKSYKENLTVLREMFNAYNFETPEYTKENYQLFKNQVAPSLRADSDALIEIFQSYSERLEQDLAQEDSDLKEQFRAEWRAMKDDQLDQYISFLTHQEELLQAYSELITFYYVHSNLFTVDNENNVFLFTREEDAQAHDEILQKIEVLKTTE